MELIEEQKAIIAKADAEAHVQEDLHEVSVTRKLGHSHGDFSDIEIGSALNKSLEDA